MGESRTIKGMCMMMLAEKGLGDLPAAMDLPLSFGHAHEHFNVLDRNPAGKNFHAVFKVRFQDDITHAVDQSSRGGVEYVQALAKSAGRRCAIFLSFPRSVGSGRAS